MKRKEIENKLQDLRLEAETKLETSPLSGFFAGLIIGILLAVFWRVSLILIPLILLTVFLLWLFSDKDSEVELEESNQSDKGDI